MKDVAKSAGVSLGSVSHYLNASVPVSPETAERIQRAVDALDYRVDQGARSLRKRRTQTVGLIIPDISNPFFAELARVLEHRLWDAGFQTFLCNSAHDAARERAHFSSLLARRADGIFVIYGGETSELPELAAATATPVVFLDRPVEGQLSVASDNYLGGTLAARHLLELGHTRIGALVGDAEVANMRSRMDGFRETLTAAGAALAAPYVRHGAQNLALGERAAELMRLLEPPTAIFASNDIVAVGAWRTLLAQGYRLPQDVSLLGFDNIELGHLLLPPLTTVAQDIAALGAHAAELLLGLLKNRPAKEPGAGVVGPVVDAVVSTIVAPQLIARGSTAPVGKREGAM